jgi:hypothetical protein
VYDISLDGYYTVLSGVNGNGTYGGPDSGADFVYTNFTGPGVLQIGPITATNILPVIEPGGIRANTSNGTISLVATGATNGLYTIVSTTNLAAAWTPLLYGRVNQSPFTNTFPITNSQQQFFRFKN